MGGVNIPRPLAAALRSPSLQAALRAARGVQDPALFDALLGGLWVSQRSVGGPARLRFRATHRLPLAWTLLSRAPAESAAASRLLASVEELDLSAAGPLRAWLPGDDDLAAWLPRLTGLRRLVLGNRPVPLSTLAALPRLTGLTLSPAAGQDLQPLAQLAALSLLTLGGWSGPLRALSALPVRWLLLDGGQWRLGGGPPTLQTLWLRGGVVADDDLRAAPATLRTLYLHGVRGLQRLDGIAQAEALRELELCDLPELGSLGDIAGCARLRTLRIRGTGIRDYRPLAALADACVAEVSGMEGLGDLSQLPPLRMLTWKVGLREEVRLSGLPVTDLSGLPAGFAAETLVVSDCPALSRLDGLGGVAGLCWLTTTRCPSLRDLSGLSEAKGLSGVAIREHPGPLDIRPVLSAGLVSMGFYGSAVPRRAVPWKIRWRASWAKGADLQHMAFREEPEHVRFTRTERRELARLRALLRSGDIHQAAQGVALLQARGRDDWLERELALVRFNSYRGTLRHSEAPAHAQVWLAAALLAQAPADLPAAKRLRDAIDHLTIYGSERAPVLASLADLSRLPRLERLVLRNVSLVAGCRPPPQGSALVEVTVHNAQRSDTLDVSALVGAQALATLTLWLPRGQPIDLSVLDRLPPQVSLRGRWLPEQTPGGRAIKRI